MLVDAVNQGFSITGNFAPPKGHVAESGDILRLSQLQGEGCSGVWWVEIRDDADYPTVHRTASLPPPPNKEYPARDVNSARAEKLP